jgi:hypothetical protein
MIPPEPRGGQAPSLRFGPKQSRNVADIAFTKAFPPITAPSLK